MQQVFDSVDREVGIIVELCAGPLIEAGDEWQLAKNEGQRPRSDRMNPGVFDRVIFGRGNHLRKIRILDPRPVKDRDDQQNRTEAPLKLPQVGCHRHDPLAGLPRGELRQGRQHGRREFFERHPLESIGIGERRRVGLECGRFEINESPRDFLLNGDSQSGNNWLAWVDRDEADGFGILIIAVTLATRVPVRRKVPLRFGLSDQRDRRQMLDGPFDMPLK